MTILLALLAVATAGSIEQPAAATEVAPVGPDRSAVPTVAAASALAHPQVTEVELSPGVVLRHVRAPGVRHVVATVYLHHGGVDLDALPAAATSALSALWDVATDVHDAEALELLTDRHQISLSAGASNHSAYVEATAPREALTESLDLLKEVLRSPSLPARELARWKRETELNILSDAPSSPGSAVRWGLSHAWYPADHAYGLRPDLTAIRRVKRADMIDRHARLLRESPITVQVVGDIDVDEVRASCAAIVEGLGDPGPWSEELPVPPAEGARLFVVDVQDLEQTTIMMRALAPNRFDDDHIPFSAVQFALGGSFLSRLNENLRERNGFTYGVSAGYSASDRSGRWTVQVQVAAENTGAAIREIQHEIDRVVADGVTPEEIDANLRDEITAWNDTFATASSADGFYYSLLDDRETVAQAASRLDALAGVTPEAAKAAAARWIAPDQPRVWFLAGDRDVVEPQLTELGITPTWLTPEQAVLGEF